LWNGPETEGRGKCAGGDVVPYLAKRISRMRHPAALRGKEEIERGGKYTLTKQNKKNGGKARAIGKLQEKIAR